MRMWHHVINHLIISNDKDLDLENQINYASVTMAILSFGMSLLALAQDTR
jgi:hypothetical protein